MISEELIVDDRLTLLVPKDRHTHAARIARVGKQIDLGKFVLAIHVIAA